MTVADLIALLEPMPKDALVLVPGYEEGWDTVGEVSRGTIGAQPKPAWYYGRYGGNGDIACVFINANEQPDS